MSSTDTLSNNHPDTHLPAGQAEAPGAEPHTRNTSAVVVAECGILLMTLDKKVRAYNHTVLFCKPVGRAGTLQENTSAVVLAECGILLVTLDNTVRAYNHTVLSVKPVERAGTLQASINF